MPVAEAVRAWKDEDYWMSLTEEERASLPENPAGDVQVFSDLGDDPRHADIYLMTFPIKHCFSIVLECSASNCA
jgi:mersacidin/lichenicidin family type 2 lantibiotic